jgi:DNA-binding winged helix-turn-helix (wHTH) protein
MEIEADKNRVISFGVFQLDTRDMELRRGGQSLELTPKALDVLHYLLLHSGRLVRKKELLEAVWSQSHVSEAVIKVCIREIRKTLGDEATTPRFIETVRSRGYRFVGNIQLSTSESSSVQNRAQAQEEPVTESLAPLVSPPRHSKAPVRSVGREAVFAELQKRLERACHGERQVLFITGEAGIGKMTTVNRFLEGLGPESAYWIARGQCLEQYGAGEAFMPVLEALPKAWRRANYCSFKAGCAYLVGSDAVPGRQQRTRISTVPDSGSNTRTNVTRDG